MEIRRNRAQRLGIVIYIEKYKFERNVLLILASHYFPDKYIRALCAASAFVAYNLRNVTFLVTCRAATTVVTVVIRINSSRV